MNIHRHPRTSTGLAMLGLLALLTTRLAAADFNVSSFGSSSYLINGQPDPTLTLTRGRTYTFEVTASGHPFWIKTVAVTGTGNAYNNGVTGNGVQVGTLTYVVPTDAPDTIFYICQIHSAMRGTINIVSPPLPPAVNVLSIAATTNVIVRSTGAEGWNLTPEFTSNVLSPVWTNVPVFQNVLADGTNTTTFDLIQTPGDPVIIRIRLDPN